MPSLEGIPGAFGAARGPVTSLALHFVTINLPGRTRRQSFSKQAIISKERVTYEWNAAVSAHGDLRLVGIYEDSGMAKRTTASITRNTTASCPSNWLLVNQGDGSLGFWLLMALACTRK